MMMRACALIFVLFAPQFAKATTIQAPTPSYIRPPGMTAASECESYNHVANGVDGSWQTKWGCYAGRRVDGSWHLDGEGSGKPYYIDLGDMYEVRGIRIGWGDLAADSFDVSVSQNNATFANVLVVRDQEGVQYSNSNQTLQLSPVVGKYIRIDMIKHNSYSLAQQFYGIDVRELYFALQAPWDRCACEHNGHPTFADCTETNVCQCTGEVRYGHGGTWSVSKQVDESIECSNSAFGDPLFDQSKECQCKQAPTTEASTTEAPTTEAYVVSGSSTCPTGFETITNQETCQRAGEALRIWWGGASGRRDEFPTGCFSISGTNAMWFNANAAGTTPSDIYSSICAARATPMRVSGVIKLSISSVEGLSAIAVLRSKQHKVFLSTTIGKTYGLSSVNILEVDYARRLGSSSVSRIQIGFEGVGTADPVSPSVFQQTLQTHFKKYGLEIHEVSIEFSVQSGSTEKAQETDRLVLVIFIASSMTACFVVLLVGCAVRQRCRKKQAAIVVSDPNPVVVVAVASKPVIEDVKAKAVDDDGTSSRGSTRTPSSGNAEDEENPELGMRTPSSGNAEDEENPELVSM